MDPKVVASEIEKLVKRGKKLKPQDLYTYKSIKENPISTFLMKPYVQNNKLHLKDLLIDIQNFIKGNNLDDKLKYIFNLYDFNRQGKITNANLYKLILAISASKDETLLQQLVDKVFFYMKENTNCIVYEEFKEIIKRKNRNLETYLKCNDKFFKF